MQDTVTRSSVNWLAHWAEVSPGDAALVIGQRGKVSFGDLAQSVARMAKLLAAAVVFAAFTTSRVCDAVVVSPTLYGSCSSHHDGPSLSRVL